MVVSYTRDRRASSQDSQDSRDGGDESWGGVEEVGSPQEKLATGNGSGTGPDQVLELLVVLGNYALWLWLAAY